MVVYSTTKVCADGLVRYKTLYEMMSEIEHCEPDTPIVIVSKSLERKWCGTARIHMLRNKSLMRCHVQSIIRDRQEVVLYIR